MVFNGKTLAVSADFSGGCSVVETDGEYFDIVDYGDNYGLVSLKPEYRGAAWNDAAEYQYGVSDMGKGKAGSRNHELPQKIVIPEIVNDIVVTSLAPYMFGDNTAVASITIPAYVEVIPERFCEGTLNLRNLSGTQNVEVVGKGAFQYSGITKAIFPKLKEMGTHVFNAASLLVVADLGEEITAIPDRTFYGCSKLSSVRCGDNIVSVGDLAFLDTKRLKTLPFLSNLASIARGGFRLSRIDYDWNSLQGCTFGELAVSSLWNTEDFWRAAYTFTPCKIPLKSTFNQHNPEWEKSTIGDTTVDYTQGCNVCCAAMLYSIYENKELHSPKEFEEIVRAANPSIMSLDPRPYANIKQYLEAVGYTVEHLSAYNATNIQKIYNALADGALVMAASITTQSDQGHTVLLHGVNGDSEVLTADPYGLGKNVGVYEADTYTIHLRNIADQPCDILIVRK